MFHRFDTTAIGVPREKNQKREPREFSFAIPKSRIPIALQIAFIANGTPAACVSQ
jgi:hypothetical protein